MSIKSSSPSLSLPFPSFSLLSLPILSFCFLFSPSLSFLLPSSGLPSHHLPPSFRHSLSSPTLSFLSLPLPCLPPSFFPCFPLLPSLLFDQPIDHKNIRRRVYDALNVLMAMNIISKEKKEIKWIGLPTNSVQECQHIEVRIFQYFSNRDNWKSANTLRYAHFNISVSGIIGRVPPH